jgi:hypothetical protein
MAASAVAAMYCPALAGPAEQFLPLLGAVPLFDPPAVPYALLMKMGTPAQPGGRAPWGFIAIRVPQRSKKVNVTGGGLQLGGLVLLFTPYGQYAANPLASVQLAGLFKT